MRKRQLLCFLLLAIFLCGTICVRPDSAQGATTNWGEVKRDYGVFSRLEFPVTNTAPGTIVWRTDVVIISFNRYQASFTGSEIGLWGTSPTGTISITAQQLADRAGTTVDVVRSEADNPSGGFILSAVVHIYNKNTNPSMDPGRAIGAITDPSQIDTVIGPNNPTCGYTFPVEDRQAIATRWGIAYNPIPQQEPNLKITDLIVTNSSGQTVSSLKSGQTYYVQACFIDETCPAGSAPIYAYLQTNSGLSVIGSGTASFSGPGSTFLSPKWMFTAVGGNNTVYASVNCSLSSGGVGVIRENKKYQGSNGLQYTEKTYDDNWLNQNYYAQTEIVDDQNSGTFNLKAMSIKLQTPSGTNLSGPPTAGVPYKAVATFTSYYPRDGWGTMRLYLQNGSGSITQAGSNITKFFAYPGNGQWATMTESWDITFPDNKNYTLYASIDSRYEGSWTKDPFITSKGAENETTWEDNVIKLGATATEEKEPGPPQPMTGSVSSYYPVWETPPPKVQTETITTPVYGWKEVKFIPAPRPKIHVRLVE